MQSDNESDHLNLLLFESVLEHLQEIDQRLTDIELGPYSTARGRNGSRSVTELKTEIDEISRTLGLVNRRAANMRLDRQVILAVRRLFGFSTMVRQRNAEKRNAEKRRLLEEKRALEAERISGMMTATSDILIVCPAYPGGERRYGGEFVQKRVAAYQAAGYNPAVVEVSQARTEVARDLVDGADVLRINPWALGKVLKLSTFETLVGHSVEKAVWSSMREYVGKVPIGIWVHGYEARDWRELSFNFSDDELTDLRPRLNKANDERRETMSEIFGSDGVEVIFVSNFMKEVAEDFATQVAKSGHVIHNCISGTDFPYVEKTPEHRKRILWVRSFAAKNYSHDISTEFILQLSEKTYFDELAFSIYGDGRFFYEATKSLRKFSNVKIEQRFLSVDELRAVHAEHGLMLVPTRWDSQGLTSGEAMSSGLVPLTSSVAAIPEFTDETCAILAPFEDASRLVEGVDRLFHDPDLFLSMSRSAALRAQSQCGLPQTTDKEIELIRSWRYAKD